MITLWLIRHGETDWNANMRFQGSSDVPLNALGREQAANLTPYLVQAEFDAIYASDLIRVRTTAEIVLGDERFAAVQFDPRLREMDFGKFEGLTWDEIKAQYPTEFAIWTEDRSQNPHGGESLDTIVARITAFIADLRARHDGQRVLLFAHGGAFAVLLCVLMQFDAARWWQFRFLNCSLSQVLVYENSGVLIRHNVYERPH